jgi:hypothetical protein
MPLPDIFIMIAKTAEYFGKPDNRGLDTFDRVFLRMGQLAEDVGVGGDKLKMFNRVVGRGDKSEITEKDLSADTLRFLSSIVSKKSADTKSDAGYVNYSDYGKYGDKRDIGLDSIHPSLPHTIAGKPLLKDHLGSPGQTQAHHTLGQFKYKKDGNDYVISDTYDFSYRDPIDPVYKPASMILDTYNYARNLAARAVPDNAGEYKQARSSTIDAYGNKVTSTWLVPNENRQSSGAPVKIKIPRKP